MTKLRIRNVIPNDGRHWAVVAFGRELYDEGSTQVRKELILLPLQGDAPEQGDGPTTWSLSQLMNAAHQRTVTIPIGLVMEFELASVWRRDEQVGALKLETREIKVHYSPKYLRIISAGLERNDDEGPRKLVPYHRYPLALLAPQSRLVAIAGDGYAYRYLVPSTVLNVFYFCGSSELCQAVHSPGIGQPNNPVWDHARSFYDRKRIPHIHLAANIPFEDRRIVAAMFSPYGQIQAKRLYESNFIEPKGYAATFPPFQGRDTLTVEGLTIKSERYERFLILRIRSGSLPIAFPKVIIANEEYSKVVTIGIEDEGDPIEVESHPGGLLTKEVVADAGTTSSGARRTTVTRLGLDRFTNQVKVERAERIVEVVKPQLVLIKNENPPTDVVQVVEGAVGPPNPAIAGATTNIVLVAKDSKIIDAATPAGDNGKRSGQITFGDTLKGLQAFSATTNAVYGIRRLTEGNWDETKQENYFPLKYGGKKNPEAYLYKRGQIRRQILVVELTYRKVPFVLLEAQRRSSESFQMAILYRADAKEVQVTEIERVADAAARCNYVWQLSGNLETHLRRLKHIWDKDKPTDFVALFTSVLDQLLAKKV